MELHVNRENWPEEGPRTKDFWLPTLEVLAHSTEPMQRKLLVQRVVDACDLTKEQLALLVSSGAEKFSSRANWAVSTLYAMDLIQKQGYGLYEISPRGRELLSRYPAGLNEKAEAEFSQLLAESQSASTSDGTPEQVSADAENTPDLDASPNEEIDKQVERIEQAVRKELLDAVLALSPRDFELFVPKILQALGYGPKDEKLLPTQASHDGGIDGIIPLDPLGLQKLFVQAKRWATDKSVVGQPDIHTFMGALKAKNANLGVFIATCGFSSGAVSTAREQNIVLIDGKKLIEIMMDNGVGVRKRPVYLPEIDKNFFESL